ncbi:MAG: tetratricopeptide repeat protein [Cyanophyceae cyanobacterium]
MDDIQQRANDLIAKAKALWANAQWDGNAMHHRRAEQLYDAAMYYTEAAQLYDPYRTFFLVAGECYLKVGSYGEAEGSFRSLVDFRPNHHQGWWMLGQAVLSQNRPNDAESHFDRSIELGSTDVEPYYYGAMVKSLLGKNDAVLPLLRKALEIQPSWKIQAREESWLRDYVDLL